MRSKYKKASKKMKKKNTRKPVEKVADVNITNTHLFQMPSFVNKAHANVCKL